MLVSTARWKKTRISAVGMAQIGTLPLRVLGQLSVAADFPVFVDYDGAEYEPPSPELAGYMREYQPAREADFTFKRPPAAS